MVNPQDERVRIRFASELDRNFSVVASAGSGKTTAITERILSIARSLAAAEILPRLVVVTFTNRAADEMQQRTRHALLEENLPKEVQTAFNRAFFGTIHSFCMKLLTDFGHYLGLPAPLELAEDDDDLWQEFVQKQTRIGESLGENNRAMLLRFVQARDLMELGRRVRSAVLRVPELWPCPRLDFSAIYNHSDQAGRDNIAKSQAELRDWEKRFAGDWEYLRWPICFTAANAKFTQLWQEKFARLRRWICDAATCVAAEVQRDYLNFRLDHGLVTYADQIALAEELLQQPVAAQRIREENYHVILDEAQDTERLQFSVLLEVTRPPEAKGRWLQDRHSGPRPGYFCMVGDFQQSIYWQRADLNYYRTVHEALISDEYGESLEFAVTFRLDHKQLDFVNETFREILNDRNGQVRFVELQPRPNILPGKVIRLPLARGLLPEGKKLKDYQKARIEAEYLATWIKNAGLKKLSADSWREVAILCPRKAWLQTTAAALRRIGIPVAIQSERDVKGDSPAYAWLTALVTVMTDPLNAYEIVGVLREVFGASDYDLAVFSEGNKARFRIDEIGSATGRISSILRMLAEIRQGGEGLALLDAVTLIIEQTQLRERLRLLPATEFGDLARELDALVAQAAEAESTGMILRGFAEQLRNDFASPRAVRFSADDNAIQLITSHKAKGSEWQAVIVPFLARELRSPSPRYPDLVKSPADGELIVAFHKDDKSKDLRDAIERAQQQELERLLYVATTRARHTLVIVLDQEIFSNNDGKLPKTAQLRRLILDKDSYSGEFDRHSTIDEIPESSSVNEETTERSDAQIEPLMPSELKRAAKRASEFVRKITPSTLELEVPIGVRTHSRVDTLATLYGRWWHKFLQRLDWKSGIDAAQNVFEKELPTSPDAKAAVKDWHVTRGSLFSDATIAAFLTSDDTLYHAEFPFSWRRDDRSVFEGLIDLIMIDRKAGRCLLLDWKTNHVSPSDVEIFRETYRPQLAAYWKAVTEITGLVVQTGLFSTALGRLLIYSAEELKNEWRRLDQLPPAEMENEIRPNAGDD